MFRIRALPAEYGDSLLIEYGQAGETNRMLIDCGPTGVYSDVLRPLIEGLSPNERRFELLVITHVDADHIGGALPLLRDLEDLGVSIGEVWFNGFQHLPKAAIDPDEVDRSVRHGEQLSKLIFNRRLRWNTSFDENAVVVPDVGDLPEKAFKGMKLTLLSPYSRHLADLAKVWWEEIREAGIQAGQTASIPETDGSWEDEVLRGTPDVRLLAESRVGRDTAVANGSSIAFLASYDEKTVLFGADAFSGVLTDSLRRVRTPTELAAFKVPHHGSAQNIDRELLASMHCKRHIISTNGKRFGHPNPIAIAKLISFAGGELHFNYQTPQNEMWMDSKLLEPKTYTVTYGGSEGSVIEL
ncbi:hypothetical protein DSM104443_01105 [Usitatibacter rugosus]|uniref:Metallo-beta-lactamase domain-containing protein n=1 Tax=Usitatibacter rugosus TaxID=2732067 RepID=A0A6M4GU91_9PROT|nr:MBL fold metallo-hydrolase [Usitatibacter rugosus]QJR10054.1 hypothetical protein DSM104443_01105 [Usitatibacter rugosus]